MLNGIKISTKISVLVILISLVAVGAISFFTYDFNLKTNREKVINNLNVITENRSTQINTYFEKVAYGMAMLQASNEIKNGGGSTSAAPADDFGAMLEMPSDSASAPAASPLVDYLNTQKEALGFDQLYITSKTGAVSASTDNKLKSGNLLDPDGTSFENGSRRLHFSAVFKDSTDYFVYVLEPLEDGNQLLIAKVKLNG